MKLLMVLLGLTLCINLLAKTKDSHHFVHLKVKNVKDRTKVANLIHIDEIIENSAYAVVNQFDLIINIGTSVDKCSLA